MAGIAEQINKVRTCIPSRVTLVCVSKFHPAEAIREAYEAGERHFGESRVQELAKKIPLLPTDIHWHFIGHLQTNKVRDLLRLRPYIIESVDSIRILEAINTEAARIGIVQNILLEIHVAREQTKTGFSPEEIFNLRSAFSNHKYPSIRILGLMAMATNTNDEAEIRRCFTKAAGLAKGMEILSMGMSDDFKIAIECGSNSVRIGSAIFGERDYISKRNLPKAIFFDMDGTLFDSMPYHARAWEETMASHGLRFTEQDTYINEGRTGEDVIREAFEMKGEIGSPESIAAIYQEKTELFHRLRPNGAEPFPMVTQMLRWLTDQGTQCWIVTGSGQHTLLNQLDLSFPGIFTREHMITAYDVTHGKPNPEPYRIAYQRSGFPIDQCIVVENAPLGVRSGKGAGLFTIAVNTGSLPDDMFHREQVDLLFPDIKALFEYFKNCTK